ncbi:MAG: 1-(5-phosphoribosyl)-5-[(5-phosphoribosylamino)methylideneamino] imidazole-4-carboxamide isomerase [Nitrosopumilus sp. H13]|nr:MAG: 1-(5-phosphoribosyl)-5-[(5-phosphoribosylamino)methylideneamino] imidazole-4-carboxamide isomerase [Nitrosopumilus sp. H13]
MKIIPAVDLMGGKVVRLYQGDPEQKTVYDGSPADTAKKWEADGADMLHIVDLDATLGLGSNHSSVKDILNSVSIPAEVAGGLRSREMVMDAAASARRVVLGTLAFDDRELLSSLLAELGPERMVISVDHRDGQVVVGGWKKNTGAPLIESMNKFLDMGFTEFLLTNVGRDGTLEGPDLEYLRQACGLRGANVIASGGISGAGDVRDVRDAGASGVILGRALYEGMISIREARQ